MPNHVMPERRTTAVDTYGLAAVVDLLSDGDTAIFCQPTDLKIQNFAPIGAVVSRLVNDDPLDPEAEVLRATSLRIAPAVLSRFSRVDIYATYARSIAPRQGFLLDRLHRPDHSSTPPRDYCVSCVQRIDDLSEACVDNVIRDGRNAQALAAHVIGINTNNPAMLADCLCVNASVVEWANTDLVIDLGAPVIDRLSRIAVAGAMLLSWATLESPTAYKELVV